MESRTRNERILRYYKFYKEVNGNIMTTHDMGSCLLCDTATEGGAILLCEQCMGLLDSVNELNLSKFVEKTK